MKANDTLIELNQLEFYWPQQQTAVLKVDALPVEKNQHSFIRGDSGSGKTTLLNLLCGIHIATKGSVSVLGQDLTIMDNQQRDRFRGEHLGVIFQQFNLLPFLSVKDNIVLPCGFSKQRLAKVADAEQEVERLLDALDLPPSLANKNITELSVGQQQRVAVCRALIGSPELIIADEPTSALDTKNRDRFLQLLFQEADKNNSTVVFVSHDEQIAYHFPRVIELSDYNQAKI